AAERVGDHGAEGLVIDVRVAIVSRALVTQIGLQRLTFGDRQYVHKIQRMLLVKLFEVAVVVGCAQILGDLVGAAQVNELIGFDVGNAGNAFTGSINAHVFVVGGVSVIDLIDITQIQSQTIDLVGNQLGSAHCCRKQAAVAGGNRRVFQLQSA